MIKRALVIFCLLGLLVIPADNRNNLLSASPETCPVATTQSFKAYCGSAVLKEAFVNLGVKGGLQENLIQKLDSSADQKMGFNSLYEIKGAAKEAGLHTLTVETDLASLKTLTQHAQVITNITGNRHFCVVEDVSEEEVLVYIPGLNYEYPKMTLEEFGGYWDKVVLLVSREEIDLEKSNLSFKYASDEKTKEIIGAQGCGNTSGCGFEKENANGDIVRTNVYNGANGNSNPTTDEPVNISNGNLFLEISDLNIPTQGLPLELTRFYNAEIVSEVTGWLPEPGAGSWVIEDGEYSGQGDRSTSDLIADDFTLELDMQTIQPGSYHSWETAWVNIRYQENSSDPRKVRNGYYFLIHTNGKIELAKWKGGRQYWLFNKNSGYSATNKNRIRIEAYGANIKVYINGNLEIDYTDSNPVLESGRIALQSYFSHAHFDNLQITAADGSNYAYDFNTDDNEFIFGYGWTHSYNWRLIEYPTHITVIEPNNLKQMYLPLADGTFQPIPFENYKELTRNTSGWSLRSKYGIHYRFDISGRLTYIEDRNSNRTTLNYSNVGGNILLASVSEPSGRQITFSYGANNQVERVIDPAGTILQYFYDAAGHLTAVIDRNGNQTLYDYGPLTHNLTQLTDPEGKAFIYTYLYNDRVNDQTDPFGQKTTFDYLWDTTHVIADNGNIYKYNFDDNRFLQSITNPQNRMERTINDETGNPIDYYDRNGNHTKYTYDDSGNRTGIYDANRRWTTFSYESDYNQVTGITDARGNQTAFSYDQKGNLIQSVDAGGGVVNYNYDSQGQLIQVEDARSNITTFSYDTYGNLLSKTDVQNNTTTYAYDILGRLESVTDPLGNSTGYIYDPNGNLSSVEDNVGNITGYTYTPLDKLSTVTDPQGKATLYRYDCFGNLLEVADALGNVTSYTYSTIYQMHMDRAFLKTITDPKGNTTNYKYSSTGRLIEAADASGEKYTFGYDYQGNLSWRRDARGLVTQYYYDRLNRMIKIRYPEGYRYFTFDAVGNLTQTRDATGIVDYTYDNLNRLATKSHPGGVDFAYGYDFNHNRISFSITNYGTIFYTYDSLDRLTNISQPGNSSAEFSYDALSRRTQLRYPNGSVANYTYDALNRLRQLSNLDSSQNTISSFTYSYDDLSRRTQISSLRGNEATEAIYKYDPTGQLTSEGLNNSQGQSLLEYFYDRAGNRTKFIEDGSTISYTYNNLNQLTQKGGGAQSKVIQVAGTVADSTPIQSLSVNGSPAVLNQNSFTADLLLTPGANSILAEAVDSVGRSGSHQINVTYSPQGSASDIVNYFYEANGNLLQKRNGQMNETETFVYDWENRLKIFSGPDDGSTYTYNILGQRKTKNASGHLTTYYYDGDEVAIEKINGTTIYYIHGPRIDEIISDSRGYSYHVDGLGSVVNLTDANGNEAASYSYDAFGNLTSSTGSVANPWLYTGRYLDSESGLYYYRNRYYDPRVGRFISRDPSLILSGLASVIPYLLPQQLGNPQELNKYLYCINNPVNLRDPWGLEGGKNKPWWLVVGGVTLATPIPGDEIVFWTGTGIVITVYTIYQIGKSDGIKTEAGYVNNKILRYEGAKMGLEPPEPPQGWRKWGKFIANILKLLKQVEERFLGQ